ncbi:hypothetical protein SEA_CBORCH11_85 [Mycobacterium phage Cborch11]|nr:hypothetical protein SEA_CBORCH11_85 [Mycobacterium phage Cborch11]
MNGFRYEDFLQFDEAYNPKDEDMSDKPTKDQLPHEVPVNEETFVPKGMVMAPGVIPHPDQQTYPGVLVMANKPEVTVVWHNKGCARRSPKPENIKFDRNGAPWCPTCFAENLHNDPNWNSEPAPVVEIPTPIDSPKTDATAERKAEHLARVERIRAAREAGKFREPFQQKLVGDGQVVAEHKINPPERFEG